MDMSPELYKQLLVTFQAELDEGLLVISTGLIELEQCSSDAEKRKALIEKIFRTAHNIKGASRSLGIHSLGEISHAIESIFATFKNSNNTIPKSTIDICLEATDKIKLTMQSFIDKSPLPFDCDALITRMHKPLETVHAEPPEVKAEVIIPAKKAAPDKVTPIAHEHVAEESIRISLNLVDRISALSEEFHVNKIALEDQASAMRHLYDKLNEFIPYWSNVLTMVDAMAQKNELLKIRDNVHVANDLLLDVAGQVTATFRENSVRVAEYSRLNHQLQETVSELRLVPANNLLVHLPRMMRDIANTLNKNVNIEIKGGDVRIDKYVLSELKDPINHILRNAVDHGIESSKVREELGKPASGTIVVEVKDMGNLVYFNISDDGEGLDFKKIKKRISEVSPELVDNLDTLPENQLIDYLFNSGFSTKDAITDISGRGVGLDVVKKNITSLKGHISVTSNPNAGTTFSICVPLSLSSERGLIVRCADTFYVIPTSHIEHVQNVNITELVNVEGNQAIIIDKKPVPIKSLSSVLNLPQEDSKRNLFPIVTMKYDQYKLAFVVDEIIGEKEIVIKAISDPLSHILCVEGGTLIDRNKVALVINPEQLICSSLKTSHYMKHYNIAPEKEVKSDQIKALHILVVDDSITTRTLEKNILESNKFHVTVAVNGQEAWELLNRTPFSLVITDVSMPVMDGFELTKKIKTSDKFNTIPVIIVTSLGSDAEKMRGVEVGADAYIVKNEFESSLLLKKINELVLMP